MSDKSAISFETERLEIADWRQYHAGTHQLAQTISLITTGNVLKTLPPSWSVLDSSDAIASEAIIQWIMEREEESECLAIYHKQDKHMIGIIFVYKAAGEAQNDTLRLGYLIAENYWGLGYASEMISGFCSTCNKSGSVKSIIGGVDPSNIGSVKVLTKNGFMLVEGESTGSAHFYKYVCDAPFR